MKTTCFLMFIAAVLMAGNASGVVSISATKTAQLAVDNNSNGNADAGDTLKYTVVITNSGPIGVTNAVFSDPLDPNVTLVNGSVNVSPLAKDDAYTAIGNTLLRVGGGAGAGPELFVPGGSVTNNDAEFLGDSFTLTPIVNGLTANGGTVNLAANGTFTYLPGAGFVGTDTFNYTITDTGGLTGLATVTLNVSNRVWYVNNTGTNGTGRSSSPFDNLASAQAASFAADIIFVYQGSGAYTGGITLKNNQQLIGQGVNLVVNGYTLVTATSRPAISSSGTDAIALASGNSVLGLSATGSAGRGIFGTIVGTLTISNVLVSATNATAVDLENGTLNVFLISVSATNGPNGIVLNNTAGSFAVTGTGVASSGGRIQKTIGGDGASAGIGVRLINAQNVSLASMQLNDHPNFGIFGSGVTNLTIISNSITGLNGNSTLQTPDEGAVILNGLYGTASITGSTISGGVKDNLRVLNSSNSLNLTISACTIQNNQATGNDGIQIQGQGTANLTASVTGCTFRTNANSHFHANAQDTAVMSITFSNNTLTYGHSSLVGGNIVVSTGNHNAPGSLNYMIAGNTISGTVQGGAITANKGIGTSVVTGTISNNVVGLQGVADSGSAQGDGIDVESHDAGSHSVTISSNRVYQYNNVGIEMITGEGAGTAALNVKITGNTVTNPGTFAINGVLLNAGTLVGNANAVCLQFGGAGALANSIAGSGANGATDFRLRQRNSTTVRLPGYAGAAADTAAVIAFAQGNNSGSGIPTGSATVNVPPGGGFVGGAACSTPLIAAPGGVQAAILAEIKPRTSSEPSASTATLTVASPNDFDTAEDDTILNDARLEDIVAAAEQRWRAAGLTSEQVAALQQVEFKVTDLAGWYLGSSTLNQVTLSPNAAGHGWFIDPTPLDDSEFANAAIATRLYADPHSLPAGRIDLLTAVMHEMGHAAGLADSYASEARDNVMYGFLTTGERRLPVSGQASGAQPGSQSGAHYLFTPINLGTLPSGKGVTIVFQVTINSPLPSGVCQVTNQGVVTADGGINVVTDDPTTTTLNDATVTLVSPVATPTITPSPASVSANSFGNQAGAPSGYAGYAWTIVNGTITSAANVQTISYTAGASGNVTLGLTVFNASGCSAGTSVNVPIFFAPPPAFISEGCSFKTNYFANLLFADTPLQYTVMTMAFDGTNYWCAHGGAASVTNLARYSASGTLIATYQPGLDFRSVFTNASGQVLARAYADPIIYRQVSPGVFTNSGVTLTGGSLDSQSSVVLNGAGTEYIAMADGVVSRWSTNGAYLGSVNLQGFGSVAGETNSPQSRGIAAVGGFWLTYNGGGILSIWDGAGNRVTQAVLSGAGTSFDSAYSFSYCNGKVFIVDDLGGLWRGYDVCNGSRAAIFAAEGVDTWNADVKNKLLGVGSISQVDVIRVDAGNPVPTLADLRRYQAVLVYSDIGFNNNTNVGNALADYVDLDGGVVLATFGFYDSSGPGLQGRFVTGGYLPFTTGGQAQPGNLTLAADLPLHPILDGVNLFNGGSSSFHNNPISIASGAALVAHWSNGQPLVGAKEIAPGRTAGLNFFPPSSDARSDFWVASTDGARLMANALLWAGKVPPTIVTNPANQVVVLGGTVAFSVSAVGSAPLSYQWRKDGVNLPGETNSTLTFVMQPCSGGNYNVAVSNPYGKALSASAALNPPLRFLPLSAPSGGGLTLFLGGVDNCSLTAELVSHVQVYATTNVSLPLSNWTLLANPLVFTNGLIRVDGVNAANPSVRFFRAVETP
ncbi:MAG: cadherin-like domain-containing protein [Verrucomicrobia bacterium]|nr:cadherin-like domain-containing protein [Verrucomicrobiota bacterium]